MLKWTCYDEAASTGRSEGAHREVVERPVPFVDVLMTPQFNGHSCRERRDTVIHDSLNQNTAHKVHARNTPYLFVEPVQTCALLAYQLSPV